MPRLLRLPPLCAALALVLCAQAGQAAQGDSKIGGVSQHEYKGATGAVSGGAASGLYFASDVYSGETVHTPEAGSTVLTFGDTTQLSIGANSTVVLDHFVYDPGSRTGDASINFTKGIFRFVTGDIQNKSNVKLTTPTTSLTIRGTDFKVVVNDAGTIVEVTKGAVEIKPCGGTAETRLVTPGQAASVSPSCSVSSVPISSVPTDPGTDGGDSGGDTRGHDPGSNPGNNNRGGEGNAG
jgi:ferric-dicitrate binding protein FerR (iron transport regulator)